MVWGTLDGAIVAYDYGSLAGATSGDVRDRFERAEPGPSAVGPFPVAAVGATRVHRFRASVKAGLDLVLALLLLVLVSPILLVLMAGVRLDSPGAAIFRQVRVGRDGRLFEVFKLRTMSTDAEERKADLMAHNEYDGVLFKMRRDPRVTRFGALLRRSSLDELPQLLNVVRGEMALVGPRPSLPAEVALMDDDALRRFAVRPGITGLWQVSGRSNLGWDEAKALDTYYADNWTLTGDVSILLRTAKAVLTAEGAC